MSTESDTYSVRIGRYERREQMTTWVGAAFAGAIAFVAAGLLEDANPLVTQLLVTVVVFGGASLAFARVQFEWAATRLRRAVAAEPCLASSKLIDEVLPWPSGPERYWTGALVAILVTWVLVLLGIWWPQVSSLACWLTRRCS